MRAAVMRKVEAHVVAVQEMLVPAAALREVFPAALGVQEVLSVWGQEIIYSSINAIFVSRGMFLNGMNDRFLLSQDERLTPDIDKVVAIFVF